MSCLSESPIAYYDIFIDKFYKIVFIKNGKVSVFLSLQFIFDFFIIKTDTNVFIHMIIQKVGNNVYHFIVNPNASSGFGKEIWNKTELILKTKNIDYQVYFTQYQRHAEKLTASITSDGAAHTLVVLGGDGTIGEVVSGICYPEKITLGYIPIGSGNDFARGLGLAKDYKEALNQILHPQHLQKLNLGVTKYENTKRRFAVSSGFGYDAAICQEVCVSRLKKFLNRMRLGKLSYISLSISCLIRCTPKRMKITLDDNKILRFERTYFATAMNLPYEGGGCKFCPDACSDDDMLDFIVVADVPKIQALLILPTVFTGKHTRLKGVHIYRCKKAELESDVPLALHTDGETVFPETSVSMSLEETSVQLIQS